MHQKPYDYKKVGPGRYTFISDGKRRIEKEVEFLPTEWHDVYNFGFGDKMPNGQIDDIANSNNGDIVKIFTTIIDIVQDFTDNSPNDTIKFLGSTSSRTVLYNRIARTYYQSFSTVFHIWGIIETESGTHEIRFNPDASCLYSVFL